jgi:hypothetical protein
MAKDDLHGSLPVHDRPTAIADLPADERAAIRARPGGQIDHEEGDTLINVSNEEDDDADAEEDPAVESL